MKKDKIYFEENNKEICCPKAPNISPIWVFSIYIKSSTSMKENNATCNTYLKKQYNERDEHSFMHNLQKGGDVIFLLDSIIWQIGLSTHSLPQIVNIQH